MYVSPPCPSLPLLPVSLSSDRHSVPRISIEGERVSNFLQVPLAIEKIIGFGSLVCLDSFLYIFTILPIRSLLAFFALGSAYISPLLGRGPRRSVAS